MSGRRIVRLRVRGRVQGVGFRAFVADEARERGLDGWVRNRRDGSVETVAAGHAEAVEGLIAAVRRGPPAARVDALEVGTAEESALAPRAPGAGFSFLSTV